MQTLIINGQSQQVDVAADMPLLWVLRDVLGLTGTKYGCGIAQCGVCTVHLDGQPIRSCVTPISAVAGRSITTIEAIGETAVGKAVQQAWLAHEVVQCGYCQSGQIMAATALLNSQPTPDDQAIDAAMAGNLCRCATYTRIRTATLRVAVQFCHVEMSLMVCQVIYLRSAECGRVGKVLSGNQVCLASKAPLSRRGMTA